MSQISKKPGNLPVRKRLKPTVNINVASRRRKDSKDISSVSDVTGQPQETKDHNTPVSVKEKTASQCSSEVNRTETNPFSAINVKETLNKTCELEQSLSSQSNEVLLKEKSEKIDNICNQSFFTKESSKLMRSNILLHRNASKTSVNNLSLSIDDFDELDSSKSTFKKSPRTECCIVEEVVKQQNESINLKVNTVTSNKSQKDSVSEQVSHGKICTETLSFSECASKGDSSNACKENEKELDAKSLNEDSVSNISENCSESLSFDGSIPKYRRKVSGMAKRLSEARREFESRFSKEKPERSTLRMLDLIYYNPSTNPMKPTSDKPKEVMISSSPNDSASCAVEEEVDDPEEEENLDEDNNGIPAPRVKVGPNGEIVLDEQSLVIETTQSKKSKQEIANLTVVVDSGSNTTYHTYSKKKRARNDWSVKETVRFYKALQTLGTDFSLMQTLFPKRTRVDLKTKFKKEEKINGHLIEKALRFPSLFDLSELEKEPTNEGKEKENQVKKRKPYTQRRKKRSLRSLGFDEEDGPTLRKKKKRKDKSVNPKDSENNTGKENVETCHQYTSDDEYQPPAELLEKTQSSKTTTECRTLRTRKNIKGNVPDYAALENRHDFLEAGVDLLQSSGGEEENNTEGENVSGGTSVHMVDSNFDMGSVQPGSLVIVTAQCPDNPGYQICNVFMVQERSGTDCNSAEPPCFSDLLLTQSSANSNSVEPPNTPDLLSTPCNGNSNCLDPPPTAEFLSTQSSTPGDSSVNTENVIGT